MKRRFFSVQLLASVLSIFFVLSGCNTVRPDCPPSSCGNVGNITYPFRLNSDPQGCGDAQYQLYCESHRTVLYLNSSKKYYVEEISYENQVIRIVDSGLQRDDCFSLPRYSLTYDDFEYGNPYFISWRSLSWRIVNNIQFVKCSVSMNSSLYTATAPCFNTSGQKYLYVISDVMKWSDLHTSCMLVGKTHIQTELRGIQKQNYSQIHDLLLMGFELSWKEPLSCHECFAKGLLCREYSGYRNLLTKRRKCHSSCQQSFQSKECEYSKLKTYMSFKRIKTYLKTFLAARTLIGVFCVAIFLVYKLQKRHIWMDATVEEFLSKYRYHTPTRYSYSDVKKMTQGFKEKLGQGGLGSVFRGKLRSGHLVAVKVLAMSKGNGQDFINEVATIGRIHHVNVVKLLGFCSEGSKRALVYDFMPNGSLEKYIFPEQGSINPLSWEKTYKITLGIARGLEYLHRGCDMRILHFDIKPHNILLDENYIPKVSDFGLAKFYPTEQSIVSVTAVRGTLGYMAPELFYKNIGGVSYKSDVYSFGMLLLEMAGRRNVNATAANSSEIYFPLWIYDQVSQGGDMGLGNAMDDEREIAKKLIIVALWCIQMKPADRPSMGKVLEMLEGSVELLRIPSKPFLSSPQHVTDEIDATQMDSIQSSTDSEEESFSQNHAESNLLSVRVD
ncbi:rust resistance kinase Lr10-like [Tasmannia lanceolata]|uniref:rust resistance kinase Lr10-like n=1 Tax=Tasmannia lanceolata TaxID=3420 RepID=UPI0040634C10